MITVGNVACKCVTHKKDSAVPSDSCLTGGDASDQQLLTKEGFHEHIKHAHVPYAPPPFTSHLQPDIPAGYLQSVEWLL